MAAPTRTPARRQTKQRRLIYDAVCAAKSHPTAEAVYDRVRRAMPGVSLGTVYRNLQLLVADGRLRSWTRGRATRYDADLTPHDHFLCESCGLLLDLDRAGGPLAAERRLEARGFEVRGRILDLIGLCRNCRGAVNKRRRTDAWPS
jgi:Fur family ferric uptake transcriptional regulator